MTSPGEHETQGRKNERLADLLNSEYREYDEWIITTRFYSALHFVQAELMRNGLAAATHPKRQKHIQKCPTMDRSIYRRYRYLQTLSETARYECTDFDTSELAQAESILVEIKAKLGY